MFDGKLTLCVIEPRFIHMIWSEIEPFISKSLNNNKWSDYDSNQLRMILSKGEAVLLVFRDQEKNTGCTVLQIINAPSFRIADIMAVGGKGVNELWNDFINWCKNQGVTKIRGYVTPASARLWRKVNAKEVCRVIECEL